MDFTSLQRRSAAPARQGGCAAGRSLDQQPPSRDAEHDWSLNAINNRQAAAYLRRSPEKPKAVRICSNEARVRQMQLKNDSRNPNLKISQSIGHGTFCAAERSLPRLSDKQGLTKARLHDCAARPVCALWPRQISLPPPCLRQIRKAMTKKKHPENCVTLQA